MREVIQTNSISKEGEHKNPPIYLYDCSGPYSDPDVEIDIEKGLPKLRESWLSERRFKYPGETQMSLAKKGVITEEMEYIAIRENQNLEENIKLKNIKSDIPIVGTCSSVMAEMISIIKNGKSCVNEEALKDWWLKINT